MRVTAVLLVACGALVAGCTGGSGSADPLPTFPPNPSHGTLVDRADLDPCPASVATPVSHGLPDVTLPCLGVGPAVRLASVLRYALGVVPLDAYQVDFGRIGTPSVVVEDLTAALTKAIEELTRPVDAIKHQAKTVTVGISRSDETLLQVGLVREVLATGAARDSLTYRALRTLVALDPAVDAVTGWTRYRIDGDPGRGPSTVHVVDRGGIARDIPSRTVEHPILRGTKHRVASEREVTVGRGRSDGRTLISGSEDRTVREWTVPVIE